jgi:hypothetical protein
MYKIRITPKVRQAIMKRVLFYPLIALMYCSCGEEDMAQRKMQRSYYLDDELVEHFKTFEEIFGVTAIGEVRGVIDTMHKERKENELIIGTCYYFYDDTKPLVKVYREHWKQASHFGREALIMHELGHCLLKMKHREGYGEDHAPLSVMNSTLPDETVYEHKREEYIQEMLDNR